MSSLVIRSRGCGEIRADSCSPHRPPHLTGTHTLNSPLSMGGCCLSSTDPPAAPASLGGSQAGGFCLLSLAQPGRGRPERQAGSDKHLGALDPRAVERDGALNTSSSCPCDLPQTFLWSSPPHSPGWLGCKLAHKPKPWHLPPANIS